MKIIKASSIVLAGLLTLGAAVDASAKELAIAIAPDVQGRRAAQGNY